MGTGFGHWSLKRVQQALGLSRRVITSLISEGFVRPERGPRNELRFTFQDLVLLRTAHGLRRGQVPPRRILKALAALRRDLPADVHLSGVRITSEGPNLTVRDAKGPRDVTSGQQLLDFELQTTTQGQVELLDFTGASTAPEPRAQALELLSQGEQLEESDRLAAMAAYREAIALDPCCTNAYINLGAMLCEDGACEAAAKVFATALNNGLVDPLLHFNHALALEDVGQPQQAADSYRAAITVNPDFADAHHNLGLLLRSMHDDQGALRHLNTYRRLAAADG